MPHIYVHLLVWNDRRYLPDLFASLEAQTYQNYSIRILDNGSTDGTLEYVKEHHPTWIVARNVKNQGFAGGHNQLVKFTLEHRIHEGDDAFILIVNSDMILDPHCFEKLVAALESPSEIHAAQPKLYRAFGEIIGNEAIDETSQSDILDSTGLAVEKGWRMSDRGAGELDQGQFDAKTDIFAPSGTMAMYRLSVVEALLMDGEFFDGTFFAYREDCDLAWRFRKMGFRAVFAPEAKAWHYRGMYGAQKQGWISRLKNRRGQRPFFAALSTRNQLFVLLKNLSFTDAILSLPWLIFGESVRVFYGFVFESQTRKRLLEVLRFAPEMLRKRRAIRSSQVISDKEIRRYVGKN